MFCHLSSVYDEVSHSIISMRCESCVDGKLQLMPKSSYCYQKRKRSLLIFGTLTVMMGGVWPVPCKMLLTFKSRTQIFSKRYKWELIVYPESESCLAHAYLMSMLKTVLDWHLKVELSWNKTLLERLQQLDGYMYCKRDKTTTRSNFVCSQTFKWSVVTK